MYGMVNKALQGLVVGSHGDDVWREIVRRADAPSVFVSMQSYPDDVTYDLVGAAAEVLKLDAASLLQDLGRFWVRYTGREGYGSMFDWWGGSLREFLGNLDSMHARVKDSMPNLVPPAFSVEDRDDGRVLLTYRSHRDGLAPMVVGLLEGLAEKFSTALTIEHVTYRADAGHDQFALTIGDE